MRPYKQKNLFILFFAQHMVWKGSKRDKNTMGKKFSSDFINALISTLSIINCSGCCSYYWSILILQRTGDDNAGSRWPCLSICYSWSGIFQWNSSSLQNMKSPKSFLSSFLSSFIFFLSFSFLFIFFFKLFIFHYFCWDCLFGFNMSLQHLHGVFALRINRSSSW